MSRFLVIAILAFVGAASGVLLWDGLAEGVVHAPGGRHGVHGAGARLAVGAIGVAIVIWIASGILMRAW